MESDTFRMSSMTSDSISISSTSSTSSGDTFIANFMRRFVCSETWTEMNKIFASAFGSWIASVIADWMSTTGGVNTIDHDGGQILFVFRNKSGLIDLYIVQAKRRNDVG